MSQLPTDLRGGIDLTDDQRGATPYELEHGATGAPGIPPNVTNLRTTTPYAQAAAANYPAFIPARGAGPTFQNIVPPPSDMAQSLPVNIQQLNVAALDSMLPLLFGLSLAGALVCNIYNNGTYWIFWNIWGLGPVDVSTRQVFVNDAPLSNVGALINNYYGAPGQLVDAVLRTQIGATFTETLPGVAYSVVRIPIGNITAQPKFTMFSAGRAVYDPRSDSTNGGSGSQRKDLPTSWLLGGSSGQAYRNPALILADIIRSTAYGAGGDVDWPSVIVAANACETGIFRTFDMVLDREQTVDSWIETLRVAANLVLVPQGDKTKFVPDVPGSPVASYSHASGQIIDISGETIAATNALPTVTEIVYANIKIFPWNEASIRVSRPGVGVTMPTIKSTVRMQWTINNTDGRDQPTQYAYERMNKLWQRAHTMSVELFDEGLQHEPGDTITITHPEKGYNAFPVKVSDVQPTQNGWLLGVVNETPGAYVNNAVVEAAPFILAPDGQSTLSLVAASSQYITVPDSAALSPTDKLTVEFKYYATALATDSTLAAKWKHSTDSSWRIASDSSDASKLKIAIASSPTDAATNYALTPAGVLALAADPLHICMAYDGSLPAALRLRLFINAFEIPLTITGTIPAALVDSAAVVTMGQRDPAGTLGGYLSGRISEFRIWNTARTPTQILAFMNWIAQGNERGLVGCWHLNEGTGTTLADATANANNGTTHGSPAWVSSKINRAIVAESGFAYDTTNRS